MLHLLNSALSSINLTCDNWTSSNKLPFMGIVSHFIDESGSLRTIFLALKELHGRHSGENMANIFLEVLSEFAFRNKLGYFVMDNADNNDTMLRAISKDFEDVDGISFHPQDHRLRRISHIINISDQAYLFGRHPDIESIQRADVPTEEEFEEFWKLGPPGKLQNINIHVWRSAQRLQKFQKLSDRLKPRREHQIRWNSW